MPSSVLGELDRLVRRDVPGARAARALADRYRPIPAHARGDEAVLETAVREGAWVVTSDRALRGRLVAHGVTVLFPRDRHRLERYVGERDPPRRRGNG